jgi:peptidoglycan/xylan/chitin deacetylase (PgdA/CDA1 family)
MPLALGQSASDARVLVFRPVAAAALRPLTRRRSVILGYHGVADVPLEQDPYRLHLPPAAFRAQLELLKAAGFRFRTVAGLAAVAGSGPPPPGLAAVSFDDGLRNNLTVAFPILRELGIPATVYVPTGWLGGKHPVIGAAAGGQILDGDELRELVRAGWEIGAHTVSHADLSLLDYEQCRSEIERSCEEVSRLTGVPVQTFAYPFGRYGPAAVAAARDCGLRAAVTTGRDGWRLHELPRTMIGGAESISVFLLKLTGRYEPLQQSPPLRALRALKRQARRLLPERDHPSRD